MSCPVSVRMTQDLYDLIQQTSFHTGLSFSDVVRRVCVRISRGKKVIPLNADEKYYKSGDVVTTFKGIEFPSIPMIELRRLIAGRCLEELKKPKVKSFETAEVEGIDYLIKK